jgi:hypothetical protein
MNACDVCSQEASSKNPVLRLKEVGAPDERTGKRLQMCQNCLNVRELQSWSRSERDGQALRGALSHPNAARRRYSYLEDPSNIHLVRLRHDWIAARHP